MKENVDKNVQFLDRLDALKAEGNTPQQIQAIICGEFNIDGHSYRAWKSRLNLQYKGKYRSRIQPHLLTSVKKISLVVPSVVVMAEPAIIDVEEEVEVTAGA